jgi:cell surface protein SprA
MDNNSPTLDDRPEDAKKNNYLTQATSQPDMEDINYDNTMNEDERYYQYKMELRPDKMIIGQNHITDIQEGNVKMENGSLRDVKWYQFKVPIKNPDELVGSINGFSSIRFMRMFLKGFDESVVLRFAELALVRGDWRRYTNDLREDGPYVPGGSGEGKTSFNVATLNVEENSRRYPVPYVMPEGVEREKSYLQQTERELNEQSLTMRVTNLTDGDARAIYKNTNFDFRRFGVLRFYLHGENAFEYENVSKGDVLFFVRIGSDFTENYYEYEVPFDFTHWGETERSLIWPSSNEIEIDIQKLIDLKQERNIDNRNGGNHPLNEIYSKSDGAKTMSVIGTPNFGEVRIIMMGIRNPRKRSLTDDDDMLAKSVEVWVNELRLGKFEEKGGWAALGNMRVNLADLGDVALSASVSTAGFGSLESGTYDRQQETLTTFDVATNLQMGKMLPSKWSINLPLHYDFSRNVSTPEYNPLNPDVKLRADLQTYNSKEEKDSIKHQSLDVVQRQNVNIINARKDKGANNKAKNHIWNIENFDFSYAYTEVKMYNIDYEYDNMFTHNGGFGYTFSTQPKKIQPLNKIDKMKGKQWLQLFYDFNFMLYPRAVSFRTNVYRMFNESKLRNKSKGLIITEPMFIKAYEWSRDYTLAWDLAQSLKLDYTASANAFITEPQGRIDTKEKKTVIRKSFANFGKMNSFTQDFNASYQIPINKIPVFSFINSSVRYSSKYMWTASAEAIAYLGNSIENSNTKQFNITANFANLYGKSKYLRKVNQGTFGSSLKDKPILKQKEPEKPETVKVNLTRMQQDSIRKAEREEEKNRNNVGKEILDNVLRLAMMIKNISFSYTEGNGTAMTGYMLSPDIVGLNLANNASPGFLFAFGAQNSGLRYIASQNGWLTTSDFLNTPYLQKYNNNLQVKASVEPIKDLKIDLTATRTYSYTDQSYYIPDSNGVYNDYSQQRSGTFTITTICTPTFFVKSEKETYRNKNFENFKLYRIDIAHRLAEIRTSLRDDYNRGTDEYPDGYGHLDQEVLLYAFLAAYSGRASSDVAVTSPFMNIPLPNWRISYNGITKIPGVNKVFQSITLQHAYMCMYQLGGFATNMSYRPDDGDLQIIRDALSNFIPYIEVGQVAITESMNPLIGVDVTMKNSLQFKAEWRKARTVTLSLANFQVTEVANNELIFGVGYRFKELKMTFDFAGVRRQTNGDLLLRADFSIRDNKTILRKIEEDVNLASAGQKILSIAVSGEYQVTKNIFFKLFYDHTLNMPALANQYKNLTINAGFSIRIMLADM